jgi:hypothetical protein
MFCFYWIEVGYETIEDRTMTLRVYEKNMIHFYKGAKNFDRVLICIKIGSPTH